MSDSEKQSVDSVKDDSVKKEPCKRPYEKPCILEEETFSTYSMGCKPGGAACPEGPAKQII